MKNILFILHFPPPVHGSSMVGQSIKNSKLINNSFECRYISYLISNNINEIGKISFIKIIRVIGLWFKLLQELLKQRPDICYLALTSNGLAFYKDVFLIGMLRFFHIKRIYHLHNKGVFKNKSKLFYQIFYPFVFKDAEIILLSKHLYSDIQDFVPISRVFICPNGILKTALNLKPLLFQVERPVKIIFLSNLIESKGVFILLEACSILQQKGLNFECDFIGAEGDLNVTQFGMKVYQYQLSARVKYLGKKFGKEKEDIFANAEIFTLPTFYPNECFPLVLLEAMCNGLPVISTNEGGIRDIVEDGVTGFLVPQKDERTLAEKIEVLINDPELRHQMGQAGRIKFENEFTLNIFEQRLKEILLHATSK